MSKCQTCLMRYGCAEQFEFECKKRDYQYYDEDYGQKVNKKGLYGVEYTHELSLGCSSFNEALVEAQKLAKERNRTVEITTCYGELCTVVYPDGSFEYEAWCE